MISLNELTIVKALDGLKNKEFTSVDLVTACLAQIEKFDNKVKAFISVLEEHALAQAKVADAEITNNPNVFLEKPLIGIPFACKDNFSTLGFETTAGSNILRGYIPPYESTVTSKLKEAGAILLGKTNLDAFAHGSSTEESDFHTTYNPWDLSRVPGGSSGGSTAAVSANMCLFSIGSETGGSIRCPAAWCGVTGFKPSYGRVSRYGLIAMASSTDCPGPVTKTVEDSALVLSVIAGKDVNDATSSPAPVKDYMEFLKTFDPKGLTIGLPKTYFNCIAEEGVKKSVDSAIETMKSLGCKVVEIDLMDPKYTVSDYTIIQRSEVSSNLGRFDGIRFGHTRDAFGFEAKKRMMLGAYVLSAGYYDQYYSKAQKVRTLLINEFNEIFKKVDLVVAPTMPTVALNLGENKKSPIFGELTDVLVLPAAMTGLPAVSIPVAPSENLPVGLQIIGSKYQEETIFGLAHAFQKITRYHMNFPKIGEEK